MGDFMNLVLDYLALLDEEQNKDRACREGGDTAGVGGGSRCQSANYRSHRKGTVSTLDTVGYEDCEVFREERRINFYSRGYGLNKNIIVTITECVMATEWEQKTETEVIAKEDSEY